jgi:hypothetical protein
MTRPVSAPLIATAIMLCAAFAGCAGPAKKPLVDPFPPKFPLAEAGTLDIEGHIAGQPRAQRDVIYFTTREGYLSVVGVPSRSVLWRFQAGHPLSGSPVLVGDTVLLQDDAGAFYVLPGGKASGTRYELDGGVLATTPVRLIEGAYILGTADGRMLSLASWEYRPPLAAAEVTRGPTPVWRNGWPEAILFGRSDGLVIALSPKGKPVWKFQAGGAISTDFVLNEGRVYFGAADRTFICLSAKTGRKKWSRRLQGVPIRPAIAAPGRLAVAASNSVVYRISSTGGSILSWEPVPSRIIYELAAAGPLVLISSASPTVTALDLRTGKRAGQYEAPGLLVAGAVWSPPYIVLFVEDEESGRQKIVFLRSR